MECFYEVFLVTNIEWENPTALVTCTVVILTRVDMHLGQSGDDNL